MGSLIGDLGVPGTGEVEVDWLPHNAVALLTEKGDLTGDRSPFCEPSVLGGAISFNACALDSEEGEGSVRDCIADGDFANEGDDDAGLGDGTTAGRSDRCGTVRDSKIDSCLISRDAGFFGGSGVGDFESLLVKSGDFAGVAGLSFSEFLTGVRLADASPKSTSVSTDSELGRMCSVLTSGTFAIEPDASAPAVDEALFPFDSACLLPGARLLGPRALPFVIWVNSGAGPVFSSGGGLTGLSPASSFDTPAFPAMGGGPLANIFASAGLKRSASLLDLRLGTTCDAGVVVGCVGFSSTIGLLERRLFLRAMASGVTLDSFGGAGLETLSDLPKFLRAAIASGAGASFAVLSVLL